MSDPRFSALSPRQKDCLRLSYQRMRTKEIAKTLGISPGTAGKYCTQAIAVLGAKDRREAAEMLAQFEESVPPQNPYPPSEGVAADSPSLAASVGNETPSAIRRWLPLRVKGSTENDLSIFARLVWVPALAIILAIAFGMLAIGVRVISQLFFGGR